MSDSPVSLDWLDVVAEFFGRIPRDLKLSPIVHHDDVWPIEIDGRIVAVAKRLPEKRSLDAISPVRAEATVLQCVSPPAVRCLAHFENHRILLTRWAGQTTINDAMQQSPDHSQGLALRLVERFSLLEHRFAESRGELIPVAYPMDYPRYLRDSLDGVFALASSAFGVPDPLLQTIESQLSILTPTLGPLDSNAQNAVVSGDSIWFLDMSRIGWDWPERRLVQYAFCLGAHGGRPRSVLTPEAAQHYAQRMSSLRSTSPRLLAFGLDAHAFLASLVIVDRLRQLTESPNELAQLRLAWDAPVERLACMRQIIDTPLSADTHIRQARDRVLLQLDVHG